MLTHSKALWRIDYRADLTRSNSLVIPVGFALEARWSNDVRWLGMLFRKRLSDRELETVNIETWPEMKNLESFMKELFEQTWDLDVAVGDGAPALASGVIASKYSARNSLQFVPDVPEIKLSDDVDQSFTALYAMLLRLHDKLTPSTATPVIPLPRPRRFFAPAAKQRKLVRQDVELFQRAA
jgi:hypothetical protein